MKFSNKKVSICIPAYGVPLILEKTLNSILIQSYKNYEVIISDDSPDSGVKLMVSRHKLKNRINYHHNETTLGSPENWNKAVLMSSGEYIKIIHHDDVFTHEHALKIFVESLDADNNCDFIFSSSYAKNGINGSRKLNAPSLKKFNELRGDKLIIYERNFIGAPSSTLFRRSAFIRYDKNLKWLVDVDSYISYLSSNSNIKYIIEPLIETTSNADHQVTRLCENNQELEIQEYYYIYKKYRLELLSSKSFRRTWFYLFDKYNIREISDIDRSSKLEPVDIEIFRNIILEYQNKKLKKFAKLISKKIAGNLGLRVFNYFFGY